MRTQLKKGLAVFLSVCCLSGCGNGTNQPAGSNETVQKETLAETIETEKETESTEAKTGAEEQNEHSKAILVVSFGTSYNDSRDITIGAIEKSLEDAFLEYPVRRAFTSQIIIDKLAERDGLEIDNVTQALDRAVADGFKNLIVRPTHLMNGLEYMDIVNELKEYESDFEKIAIGEPLLTSDADYEAVINAITEDTKSYDDGETAIVYMGHGTEAESNQVYATMQEKLTASGHSNYYIGTVEAAPTLEDVVKALKEAGTYKKVVLQPLMVVAGDHANNDMAGDEEDSWKTALEAEGFEVESRLVGLGELAGIREIYVQHTQAAIDSL